MVLQQLQTLLGRLYDVPGAFAVADFLITDRGQFDELQRPHSTDETVLLREDADGVSVGVYIDAQVMQRLAHHNPFDALGDANLGDYCTALEGVSHFHYLTWRAAQADSVSLLELELQAEVDKYAAAVWLLTIQRQGRFPYTLHERMFHCVRMHESLDACSAERYRSANHYAARFCRRLDEAFLRVRRARPEAWLQALRRFYRLGHAQKLRHAAA